ncbi:MAG: hypothetical protein IJ870_06490 [Alphaproteobacteria bacterium]|nr:hypothetical protein [Alphaproteobacteria bacterium]
MRKSLYFAIVSGVSFLALNATAAVPSGCADNGDGTCSYQDKNVTAVYDTANGRIISKDVISAASSSDMGESGSKELHYSYSYDEAGNLSSMSRTVENKGSYGSSSTATINYTYDSNNNLVSATGGDGSRSVYTTGLGGYYSYGTDSQGNRTITANYGGGTVRVYTYNDDGILIKEDYDSNRNGQYKNGERETINYDDNGAFVSSSSYRYDTDHGLDDTATYNVTYNDEGGYVSKFRNDSDYDGSWYTVEDTFTRDTNYVFDDGTTGVKETHMTLSTSPQESYKPLTETSYYYNDDGKKVMDYTQTTNLYDNHVFNVSLNLYDENENYIGTGHMGEDGRIADKKISTSTGYLEEIYTRDENGNITSVLENTYDKKNNLLSSRTKTYHEDGSYDVESSDGSVTRYDKNGREIKEAKPHTPKRIYTVEEASAVSKPTGNTFRLRYK